MKGPMPPTTDFIAPPTTGGKDAYLYLAANGITPRTPTIRSSDWHLASSNPFLYYLIRRLGLSDPFRWSKALSRGSWLHKRFEAISLDATSVEDFRRKCFEARAAEIETTAESFSLSTNFAAAFLDREEEDSLHAFAWLDAILDEPLPRPLSNLGPRPTLRQNLTEEYEILGHEVRAVYTHPQYPLSPLVAQLDMLLYHRPTNKVWIFDPKSVDGKNERACTNRLLTCPWEFQTLHYLFVTSQLLVGGILHPSLPKDATLGGMIHLAFAKPSIKLCDDDRAFTTHLHTLKSGPRKGQVEERREYFGVPLRKNYIARCREWLLGIDRYADLGPERQGDNPCINISRTSATVLDGARYDQYHSQLSLIYNLATCQPYPNNFFPTAEGICERPTNRPTPYAPFFGRPILEWPSIVIDRRLMQAWRDEDLLSEEP